MSEEKKILVLARNDHTEAMRVAGGLTIFGHSVEIVFVDRPIDETPENLEQAELLEITEIEPVSLVSDPNMETINQAEFASRLLRADHVYSF